MSAPRGSVNWQDTCERGVIAGLVLGVHLLAVLWMISPADAPAARAMPRDMRSASVMRVRLLWTAPRAPVTPPPPSPRPTPTPRRHNRAPLRATAIAAPSSRPRSEPIPTSAPAYIAGGALGAELHSTRSAPRGPQLPGGHHYLAQNLAFVPVEQQSIEGKLHKVAGLLFGGFDPTCKNAKYEQAKPRAQQIADGYTPEDLARLVREHCH